MIAPSIPYMKREVSYLKITLRIDYLSTNTVSQDWFPQHIMAAPSGFLVLVLPPIVIALIIIPIISQKAAITSAVLGGL